MRGTAFIVSLLGAALVGTVGCASPSNVPDSLDALLWMRTSVEYGAVTRQTYRAATEALDDALADPGRCAAPGGCLGDGAPPAVILDVDETTLDNSAFEARLLREGRAFDWPSWERWLLEGRAVPVPGVAGFLEAARARGVAVFFVTNRRVRFEAATVRNLHETGLLPASEGAEQVLLRDERPEWGADKAARIAHVASTHRVLLLLGDDLHDFISVEKLSPSARREAAAEHVARWGKSWFLLPNPVWGSWMAAAYGYDESRPAPERRRMKIEALGGP